MATPTYSSAQLRQWGNDPHSIPAPGKYGEGEVVNILAALKQLKEQTAAGQRGLIEYNEIAAPLVKEAYRASTTIGGGGSKAANAVVPYWNEIMSGGYATVRGGQIVATLPFSQQEYAKLPEWVLPTQDQIKKGLFDPTTAPMNRVQAPVAVPTPASKPVQPTQSPPAPGQPAAPGSPPAPVPQPLPQINPDILPGVDLRTDQGQITYTGQQNANLLQDVLNKQFGVNQTAIGNLKTDLAGIPDIYNKEGQSQSDQLNALADQQKSSRAQALTDLASTLATNQMNQFNRAIPDLAEQANTKGIYRSTGFGNILAQKYANLTEDTQNQLALQGISDRNVYLNAQKDALSAKLGYSGQGASSAASNASTVAGAGASALQGYASGLSDVANTAIGANNAGLQRQFSLQDFLTQQNAAQQLANSVKTQGPTGKNSPGTQAWIQGSLGAINAGANVAKASQGKGA